MEPKFEGIRGQHAHKVSLVRESGGLTCVPYAFALADNRTYQAVAVDFEGKVFAGAEFIAWLLDGRLHEVADPAIGLLGLYFFRCSVAARRDAGRAKTF
jgi:hypothetical protein